MHVVIPVVMRDAIGANRPQRGFACNSISSGVPYRVNGTVALLPDASGNVVADTTGLDPPPPDGS